MAIDYKDKEMLCEHIIKKVTQNMSGAASPICLFNLPSDVYSIGSLSANKNIDNDENTDDLWSKYAPSSMGMSFLAEVNANTKFIVNIGFDLYYRVLPTYKEQTELKEQRFKPVLKYKRLSVQPEEIELIVDANKNKQEFRIEEIPALKKRMNSIYAEILNDPDAFPDIADKYFKNNIDDLKNEGLFNSKIEALKKLPKKIPQWTIKIRMDCKKSGSDKFNFYQLTLINGGLTEEHLCRQDDYIFNVQLIVKINEGVFRPFVFNLLEDSYRFNREMWGLGMNCSTDEIRDGRTVVKLSTVNAPVYGQKRYGTRTQMPDKRPLPELLFNELAVKPLPVLNEVLKLMLAYKQYWQDKPEKVKFINTYDITKDRNAFAKTIEEYDEEISRFKRGIDLLADAEKENSKYHWVYKSFLMMNETFEQANANKAKNITSWRPFQLVYIVTVIYDIAAQHWADDLYFQENDNDKVSIIWFPTGGGKTEAYLGLSVFNMFFDRLRGKNMGMTVLLRFPLRILTLQQFQRVFNIILYANRVKNKYALPGLPFSVGYWAGDDQTPNRVRHTYPADEKKWGEKLQLLKSGNLQLVQKDFRKVNTCPLCGAPAEAFWLKNAKTIGHRCSDITCEYHQKPFPILICDEDLYERLPTAIISTVDKIASIGSQGNFLNLFGGVKYYSKKEGFSWKLADYEDKNSVEILSDSEIKLLRPTIQIQDELHLIKEDLGAYDSHYETMIARMQRNISGNYAWKVIASTATIKESDRHVAHLYGKKESMKPAVRFPAESPGCDESFYSVADKEKIGRFYVGITGHNRTHINTIVDVIYYFHKSIKELQRYSLTEFNRTVGTRIMTEADKKELISYYEISLNYVLTKRNADQIAESIDSQIGEYLYADRLSPINNEMLTGGTLPEKLGEVLQKVQEPPVNDKERISSITATSMISHGVDIDRFNFMTFFGLPRQTAEYIQASSRVGRNFPGITIDVFAPQKERDRSYYQFFNKYHEYLERLVEAPAINRWAKFSIDKTIPGLLAGYILNVVARRNEKSLFFGAAKELIDALSASERADCITRIKEEMNYYYITDSIYGKNFKEKIIYDVDTVFGELKRVRSNSDSLGDLMKRAIKYKPMTSLRDTEDEARFSPSDNLKNQLEKIKFTKE